MSGYLIPNLTDKYLLAQLDFDNPSSPSIVIIKSSFSGVISIVNDAIGEYRITNTQPEFAPDRTLIFVSPAQRNPVGVIGTFNITSETSISMDVYDWGSSSLTDPSAGGVWSLMILVPE